MLSARLVEVSDVRLVSAFLPFFGENFLFLLEARSGREKRKFEGIVGRSVEKE